MKELKNKRKKLKARCPCTLPNGKKCNSSQIRYRKLIKNWICGNCGNEFLQPESDT